MLSCGVQARVRAPSPARLSPGLMSTVFQKHWNFLHFHGHVKLRVSTLNMSSGKMPAV